MGRSLSDRGASDGVELRTAGLFLRSQDAAQGTDATASAGADADRQRDCRLLRQFLLAAVRFRQDAVAETAERRGRESAVFVHGGLLPQGDERRGAAKVLSRLWDVLCQDCAACVSHFTFLLPLPLS